MLRCSFIKSNSTSIPGWLTQRCYELRCCSSSDRRNGFKVKLGVFAKFKAKNPRTYIDRHKKFESRKMHTYILLQKCILQLIGYFTIKRYWRLEAKWQLWRSKLKNMKWPSLWHDMLCASIWEIRKGTTSRGTANRLKMKCTYVYSNVLDLLREVLFCTEAAF